MPKRRVDADTRIYWQGCSEHKLMIARCQACRTYIHPPAGICPNCWSDDIGHEAVSGKARVYTFTETPSKDGDNAVTVWAELVEQERLIVLGALDKGSGSLRIGDELRVIWHDLDGGAVPAFAKEAEQ